MERRGASGRGGTEGQTRGAVSTGVPRHNLAAGSRLSLGRECSAFVIFSKRSMCHYVFLERALQRILMHIRQL